MIKANQIADDCICHTIRRNVYMVNSVFNNKNILHSIQLNRTDVSCETIHDFVHRLFLAASLHCARFVRYKRNRIHCYLITIYIDDDMMSHIRWYFNQIIIGMHIQRHTYPTIPPFIFTIQFDSIEFIIN